jgi:hypothetical protein
MTTLARISTRRKLEALALAEGWKYKSVNEFSEHLPAAGHNVLNDTFVRGDAEVTIGYRRDSRGNNTVLQWCALFVNDQPIARYGLFGKEEPGTGGGEIRLHVKNKAKIVTDWLTR